MTTIKNAVLIYHGSKYHNGSWIIETALEQDHAIFLSAKKNARNGACPTDLNKLARSYGIRYFQRNAGFKPQS